MHLLLFFSDIIIIVQREEDHRGCTTTEGVQPHQNHLPAWT